MTSLNALPSSESISVGALFLLSSLFIRGRLAYPAVNGSFKTDPLRDATFRFHIGQASPLPFHVSYEAQSSPNLNSEFSAKSFSTRRIPNRMPESSDG